MARALLDWLIGFGGRPTRGAAGSLSAICAGRAALAVAMHWTGAAITPWLPEDSLKPFTSTGSSFASDPLAAAKSQAKL